MALKYPSAAALTLADHIDLLLENCVVGLYQNAVTLTSSTTMGDLDTATFSGYEEMLLVDGFREAFFPPTSTGAEIRSGELQWSFVAPMSGSPVTNTIYGFYVKLADDSLFLVGDFPSPSPMTSNGHAVIASIALDFGAN